VSIFWLQHSEKTQRNHRWHFWGFALIHPQNMNCSKRLWVTTSNPTRFTPFTTLFSQNLKLHVTVDSKGTATKLEPTPNQILKSDNELGAKECRIKACLKTHFHQDWSTKFFQNLPFEASWHQYSKVVFLSIRYLQSLVAKASSSTNSYFNLKEQVSAFQPIKSPPKSGEPEV